MDAGNWWHAIFRCRKELRGDMRSIPLSIFDCMIFGPDIPVSFLDRSKGAC